MKGKVSFIQHLFSAGILLVSKRGDFVITHAFLQPLMSMNKYTKPSLKDCEYKITRKTKITFTYSCVGKDLACPKHCCVTIGDFLNTQFSQKVRKYCQ